MDEKVLIELQQPKLLHLHLTLKKGTRHYAYIREDGTARLHKYPKVVCKPFEYQLVIENDLWEQLLDNSLL